MSNFISRGKNLQWESSAKNILTKISEDKFDPKGVDAIKALEWLLEDERYEVYLVEEPSKSTAAQRLNALWFYPLYAASIPFQWVILGRVGINKNSKFGKICGWFVYFD